MNVDPVFVDTWGWVALGHRCDPHHAEVKKIYRELRSYRVAIYTSDYVMDETITLLFRREPILEAIHFVEGLMAAAALGHLSGSHRIASPSPGSSVSSFRTSRVSHSPT